MTFPTVESVTRNNDNTSQTNHSVTLPATINAGDILLVMYAVSGSATVTWDNSTAGTWSSLFDQNGSTLVRSVAYWKVADGTEDGLSLTIVSGAASRAAWHIYRISGAQSVECGTAADSGGNTTAPNPPSLSPSWGSADTLWLVSIGNNATATSSTAEANYTTNNIWDTTATSGVSIHSSYRTNAASSEDPDVWTLGASRRCVSQTFAVQPGGTDASASPDAGSIALTGQAPTASASVSIAPGAGSVAIAGQAPSASASTNAAPDVGALILTGYAPTASVIGSGVDVSAAPGTGALVITSYWPDAFVVPAPYVAPVITRPNYENADFSNMYPSRATVQRKPNKEQLDRIRRDRSRKGFPD